MSSVEVSFFAHFLLGVRWNDWFGVLPAPTFERETRWILCISSDTKHSQVFSGCETKLRLGSRW